MSRVGVFGWGIVAPRSRHIGAFARNLESAESWLAPFNGFGPDNFLVGEPEFDLADYRNWIDERFPPSRFRQIQEKMDLPAQYALGAFIEALGQNPGVEEELERLGSEARVYIGTGLGNLDTISRTALDLHRAQRRWDRFWAQPERNRALEEYLARGAQDPHVPPEPQSVADPEARMVAEEAWWSYWAHRSDALRSYLQELQEIESLQVEGTVEAGKLRMIKEKQRRLARLQAGWGAPDPPWAAVSANVLWNIPNTPAAQVSMLGRITGLAFSPSAACSTFGVALKLAMDAIRLQEAKVVVVGATDPPPVPLTVGAFYRARVISADAQVSKPLAQLRGTHVAGGSVVWILGDLEHMKERGFRPLGMEPLAVGVSSDADHIITPSEHGPVSSVRQALDSGGVQGDEIVSWDLHATATPGDFLEVANLKKALPDSVLVTARKGTFGHGMAAAGGWELTAQYLGYERGRLFPTPLRRHELNPEIGGLHRRFVFDSPCEAPVGPVGKLSMGVGGVNACVVSRPWSSRS